jgi:hypothetical protein
MAVRRRLADRIARGRAPPRRDPCGRSRFDARQSPQSEPTRPRAQPFPERPDPARRTPAQHDRRFDPCTVDPAATNNAPCPRKFAAIEQRITEHFVDFDTINKHTINKHTIDKHTINKHTVNKHTVNKHTVNKHTIDKHTINKHTINFDTVNKHTINKHTINFDTVNCPFGRGTADQSDPSFDNRPRDSGPTLNSARTIEHAPFGPCPAGEPAGVFAASRSDPVAPSLAGIPLPRSDHGRDDD